MAHTKELISNLILIGITALLSYAMWQIPNTRILADDFASNYFIRLWDRIDIYLALLGGIGIVVALLPKSNWLNAFLGGVIGQILFLVQMDLKAGEVLYAYAASVISALVISATLLLGTYLVKYIKGA